MAIELEGRHQPPEYQRILSYQPFLGHSSLCPLEEEEGILYWGSSTVDRNHQIEEHPTARKMVDHQSSELPYNDCKAPEESGAYLKKYSLMLVLQKSGLNINCVGEIYFNDWICHTENS